MEKDFKIKKEGNQIWLFVETEDKMDGYSVTKAELNKLRAEIDRFLREPEEQN